MKTNRNTFNIGLVAVLALALFPRIATAQSTKTLHGHVPAAIARFKLQPTGKLAEDASIDLVIGLPLRNTNALSDLLGQMYDPSSPNFHHYLSPEQFTAQFGPSADDYEMVKNFASVYGLVIAETYSNRMVLDVRGRVSDVEKAFQVNLQTYHHPSENRDFYAPDREPTIPAALPVINIEGLDNYRKPYAHYKFKSADSNGKSKATTGSGPGGNYIGNDFRNAYVPGTSLNGSGQTVALVEFDGYLASDISEYESLAGRTSIPLQNVLLDGFGGAPTGTGGEVEVSLDIEMLVCIAPGLANIIVYEGNPFNFNPDDVLNRIASDNSARQISCSWGWSGGPSAITDQIFQEMDLQGQTFYDAVGDRDAFTAGANSVNGVDNPSLPNQPSDSPYITQVGGTTLTMSGAGAAYASETVWNWDIRYGPSADGIGSCGGISSFYAIPSWQTGINMGPPQGSTTFRNMPDVAMTADDIFVIADGGIFYPGTGGTSCAAPLWAGFTALVNQQAASLSLPSMGFINPALYAISKTPNYANCFHDITTGNNTWSQSPSLFSAVPNYDLCSGLGTPAGTNLINLLASQGGIIITNAFTHLSAPAPPYGSTMSAMNGSNPNGNWYLFVQDDQTFNSGAISNGWVLAVTTANPIGAVADDYLAMTASRTNLLVGNNAMITIGVTNFGPSVSSNVLVSDSLPFGFTYVSSSSTAGTVYAPNGQTAVWSVGNLAVSAGARLNLTIQAPNGTEQNAVNAAIVSANTPDQNPSDGSASVTLNVSVAVPPTVSAAAGGGQFKLSVGGTGSPTVIQASTNLVNWVNIYTNTPPFTFTDTVTSLPYRFYRAELQGP
jgi:uncharacterized repeat protein (TIGR01451 family)